MIEVTGRRKVTIWLNRARLWRWQHELVTRLARHPDINPVVRLADGPSPPRAFTLLLMLEKFAFRLHDDHACDLLSENAFEPYLETWDATDSGRVLDLTGHAQNGALSDLKILYDGTASDDAALLAVLDARSPALTIIDGEGRILIAGLPAVEDKTVAVRALDTIFSALLQLCVKAVTVPLTGDVQSLSRPLTENPMHSGRVLSFSATALASKLNVRIARLCHEAPRWFVAWRQIDAMEPRTSLPGAGAYHRLADDGGRYYADPFLFIADGRTHLFVEEFDQMSGKGLISASVLGSGGFERPKPVLETQSHLSYPHVFAHAGAIWMIPESLQSRTVDLYRAERFPDRWVHEATLLQNVEASDATVCQHGGLWWMFAATRSWRGSNWDTLSVFWAPELIGPWQPHAGNPILLDHRCARPAGDFFHHDGALWRPAQDCSEGYGTGLAFCRIDLLDLENVRQSVQKTVRLRDGGVRRGPHSLNRTSTIETIDLYGASAQPICALGQRSDGQPDPVLQAILTITGPKCLQARCVGSGDLVAFRQSHAYAVKSVVLDALSRCVRMAMTIDMREAPSAVIDFRGLATAFGRRKKLIAAITGICTLLALVIALFMTPRYVSQIKILIDPRGLQILPNDLSPAAASADATFAVVESQVQVITSTEVLEKVIAKLNLTSDPEFVAGDGGDSAGSSSEGDARTRAVLRTLRKRIDVRRPDRTFVLDVSVWTSSSPEKSKRIADAIAQAYLEVQLQMQTEAASRTAKALESRLSTLRQNLTNAEKQVETYRIQNNLVGGQGNLLSERELTDLTNQLSAQRIRGAELLARMEILRKRNANNPPIDTIAEALQSQTMFDLRARYAEAKKAETDSAVSLGPLHPAVITARAQVKQIRELIDVELARIQRSLETEYQRTKSVEGELNRQIIAARQVSASGQPPVQKLKDLENDVAAQRVVYETLQRRAKEVREEGMLDRTNSRVISPAAIQPAQYVVPRTLVVGGGLVIGLLAGVFAAAFLNQFEGGRGEDRSLHERNEIFNLATVSRKAVLAASRAASNEKSIHVDGLGELPGILTQALEKSPGAILIVGADGPAASSAFTLALAKQFAERGMRALTVDATETRQISKLLGLEGRPGFFDAMRTPVALDQLEIEVGELRVLPAGVRGSQEALPQTALSTQNGCALAYNGTTLIDGGAIDGQDFASLLSVVGIILVVVDAGKTSHRKVSSALQTMNPYQTRLVATVMQTQPQLRGTKRPIGQDRKVGRRIALAQQRQAIN